MTRIVRITVTGNVFFAVRAACELTVGLSLYIYFKRECWDQGRDLGGGECMDGVREGWKICLVYTSCHETVVFEGEHVCMTPSRASRRFLVVSRRTAPSLASLGHGIYTSCITIPYDTVCTRTYTRGNHDSIWSASRDNPLWTGAQTCCVSCKAWPESS